MIEYYEGSVYTILLGPFKMQFISKVGRFVRSAQTIVFLSVLFMTLIFIVDIMHTKCLFRKISRNNKNKRERRRKTELNYNTDTH